MNMPNCETDISYCDADRFRARVPHLPSPSPVCRPSALDLILAIFQKVRLPLKRQPKTLDGSGEQSDNNADLPSTSVICMLHSKPG
jgi:hypothetical protein